MTPPIAKSKPSLELREISTSQVFIPAMETTVLLQKTETVWIEDRLLDKLCASRQLKLSHFSQPCQRDSQRVTEREREIESSLKIRRKVEKHLQGGNLLKTLLEKFSNVKCTKIVAAL